MSFVKKSARDGISDCLPEPNDNCDWFIHDRVPARLSACRRNRVQPISA